VTPPETPRRRGRISDLIQRLPSLRPGVLEAVAGVFLITPVLIFLPTYRDDPWGWTLEVVACIAAVITGRFPILGSCVIGLALTALVLAPTDNPRWAAFAVAIPLVSAGARGKRSMRLLLTLWYWPVLTFIEVGTEFVWSEFLNGAVLWGLLVTVFWVLGEGARALTAERERLRAERVAAVRSQRRTIARDLHDTIAYGMTSIILRAEQAKLRGVDDPLMVADLDYIVAAGRRSMRDLRGMMETLRRNEPDNELPHSPWQISSLEEVLDRRLAELTDNGFRASAHVDADLAALPESVGETLGKVVTEATANMVKHGDRDAPCSIMIETGDGELEAVFINTPAHSPGRLGRGKTTHLGLVGARERVEALGGECDVTSTSPTWVLRARIPLGA